MHIVLCVDDSAVDRKLLGSPLEESMDFIVRYAASGSEALALIEDTFPHIVVTDLQMPDMNGLELVEAVRENFPELPVILSTAHGSEELALDALKQGAASYVPKAEVVQNLRDTIEQVLGLAQSDRRSDRLVEHLEYDCQKYCLENDPSLIPPLVDTVQRTLKDMKLCVPTQRMHAGLALQEALLNALYHGNLELPRAEWLGERPHSRRGELSDSVRERQQDPRYADRKIYVSFEVTRERAEFIVRDEGPGFDLNTLPSPEDPSALHSDSGQGLVLMENFMDTVEFNELGNEVRMVMQLCAKPNKVEFSGDIMDG